jgi:hypothetical protein
MNTSHDTNLGKVVKEGWSRKYGLEDRAKHGEASNKDVH